MRTNARPTPHTLPLGTMLIAAIALIFLFGPGLSTASELGGSVWEVRGAMAYGAKELGKKREPVSRGYLFFGEGGRCLLAMGSDTPPLDVSHCIADTCLPCNWKSKGRRLRVNFGDNALESLMEESLVELEPAAAVDGSVDRKKDGSRGVIVPKRGRLLLQAGARGKAEIPSLEYEGPMRWHLRLHGKKLGERPDGE